MAAQSLSIKNMFRQKLSSLATLDPTRLEREVGLWRCDWQWKSPIWKNGTETATNAQNVGAIKKTPPYQITEKGVEHVCVALCGKQRSNELSCLPKANPETPNPCHGYTRFYNHAALNIETSKEPRTVLVKRPGTASSRP